MTKLEDSVENFWFDFMCQDILKKMKEKLSRDLQ
jgi:hypothetical protein